MTNDIPYKHPETGQERNFPDGLGEKLGYERVVGFVPPEVQEPSESTGTDRESEVEHAIVVLSGTLSNPFNTLSEKEKMLIERLSLLFADLKIQVISLEDVAEVLEEYSTRDHLSAEDLSQMQRIAHVVLADQSIEIQGKQELFTSPSLIEVLRDMETKMLADPKMSAPSKAAMQKIIDDALAASTAPAIQPPTE
ncbi:hypothetical protein [Spirosoma litoris]